MKLTISWSSGCATSVEELSTMFKIPTDSSYHTSESFLASIQVEGSPWSLDWIGTKLNLEEVVIC